MKRILFSLFVFMMLASCSKDDCPAPTLVIPNYQVQGYYVGKYGSGVNAPSSGYSMVVEANGKVTVADGDNITSSSKAAGTYTLEGNVFKATYTYPNGGNTFSIQANFDSSTGKFTSGTWGAGASYTGSGTWFMDRRN